MLLLRFNMTIRHGDINPYSLPNKHASDISIDSVSLLKIPTKFGSVGNIRFNNVTLNGAKINCLNYSFMETIDTFNLDYEPYIYGSENNLLKSYTSDLMSSGDKIKPSKCGSVNNILLKSDKFVFKGNQGKILTDITKNLDSTISLLSNYLEEREFEVKDNRNIFGFVPLEYLSEKYDVEISMEDNDIFYHFHGNLSKLERALSKKLDGNK